jgi:hypothetical protein
MTTIELGDVSSPGLRPEPGADCRVARRIATPRRSTPSSVSIAGYLACGYAGTLTITAVG